MSERERITGWCEGEVSESERITGWCEGERKRVRMDEVPMSIRER